jgi:glycosyltransferase involved in cell wall biosynthesis
MPSRVPRGMGSLRILAFAYACEPGKGSEPGAGWIWARMLAQLGETWVITRTNNRDVIQRVLEALPEEGRINFVYVDLPGWARFWKRGQRGIRLYYILWQIAALRAARRLLCEEDFDLVWHLTLANAWLGSTGSLLPRPFIYGPVSAGLGTPWRLAPTLGIRGVLHECLRELAALAGRYVNPLARLSWRRARMILAQNQQTLDWLPRRHATRATVFPNAVLEKFPDLARPHREGRPTALFAGRLLPWKGCALAIRAMSLLPEWRLLIAGTGSDEPRLRRMARRLGAGDRVEFLGWVPRVDLLRLMAQEVDVFLYPSIHDGAPWVVAEAMACNLPVVCLDRAGAPGLGGTAVATSNQARTAHALSLAVRASRTRHPARPLATMDSSVKRLFDLLGGAGCLDGAAPGASSDSPAQLTRRDDGLDM